MSPGFAGCSCAGPYGVAQGAPALGLKVALLQGGVDRGKYGIQVAAKAINNGDDGEGDARGNETILNGRGASFVL